MIRLPMQAEQAKIVPQDWLKEGLELLETDDTKQFVGKGLYCRKFASRSTLERHIDPVWFFNEIVYSEIAKALGLNVSEYRVLVDNQGELFFGSEYCTGRKPVEEAQELRKLFEADPTQLTRALILDLLLFNNDRTFGKSGDIFSDGQEMYFIDHGHSLWGDGRCFGDLHRIEIERYNEDVVQGYVNGFLRCTEANHLVWSETNWSLAQREFDYAKSKILDYFRQACRELEAMKEQEVIQLWVERSRVQFQPRLVDAMYNALSTWGHQLESFFQSNDGGARLRGSLP